MTPESASGKLKMQSSKPPNVKGITAPVKPRESDYDSHEQFLEAQGKYNAACAEWESQIEAVVKEELERPRVYTTKEAVREWARNFGIDIEDAALDGVDMRAWDDFISVAEEMRDMYPGINFQRKATGQETQGEPITNKPFSVTYRPEEITHMQAIDDGLVFGSLFSNYESALNEVLKKQSEGYFVKGDGTMKTLYRHEWGHVLHDSVMDRIGEDSLKALCDKLNTATEGKQGKSKYSRKSPLELFAEGFAEWSSGGDSEFGDMFWQNTNGVI